VPVAHGKHAGKLRLDNEEALIENAGVDRLPALFLCVPLRCLVTNLVDEALAGRETALCPIVIPARICNLDDLGNAIP
jgi:hypothetical protein